MRRLVALILFLSFTLCACAKAGPAAEPGTDSSQPVLFEGDALLEHYVQAVLDSQPDGAEYTALSDEDVEFYLTRLYGIPAGSWESAFVYTAGGVDAREFAVIFGLGESGNYTAAEGMEAYRQSRVGDFFGYAPEQAELVEKGMVVTGNQVALLICTDSDAALKALQNSDTSRKIERFDPETTLPPDGAETGDSREGGYQKFDPPGEFDMSLYDDVPIVKAWQTGDESGLDSKQTAVLKKCREIYKQCITDGMTDFQKELAIYDWLTTHGEYDMTHYDSRTPLGKEDNTNPYGMLVKGYGVCLGYAESFRLLMELAGVECITVVGAAYDSTEDHAWNMVRLEGEWYCVDPTWDSGFSHNYFNVTSERMRDTDHQWDYDNVPEATATRFCWDGTGKLPA